MRADKWRCRPCEKTAYETESRGWAAIAAIHNIPAKRRSEVVPCRVYECPFGNGWHLTSKKEKGVA